MSENTLRLGLLEGDGIGPEIVPASVAVVEAALAAAGAPAADWVTLPLGRSAIDTHGSHIPTDPAGATQVPGVWAAGNITDINAQVIVAAAAGLRAGAAINADLVAADTREAVEAHREHSRTMSEREAWEDR